MKVFLRILLETDGPYMAVEKGGISLPGDAIYIALRVAQLKGMDWLTVVKATRENIKAVYDNTEDFGTCRLLILSIPRGPYSIAQ